MRRAVAIPMLLLLLIPVFAGFFGEAAAEASLPACCRRAGKHHCEMMAEMTKEASAQRGFGVIREKCPYMPAALSVIVLPSFKPSTAAAIYAGVQQHASVSPQTEAQQRISFDRSRQKRGPPALS